MAIEGDVQEVEVVVVVDLRAGDEDMDTNGNKFLVGVASRSLVVGVFEIERSCAFLSTSAVGVWLTKMIE